MSPGSIDERTFSATSDESFEIFYGTAIMPVEVIAGVFVKEIRSWDIGTTVSRRLL